MALPTNVNIRHGSVTLNRDTWPEVPQVFQKAAVGVTAQLASW